VKVVEDSTRAWSSADLTSWVWFSPFPNLHTSAGVARNNVMRGSSRSTDFDVVPTEVCHGPGSFDVISLANGYPLVPERRALHARRVAEQLERFPEGQFVAVVRHDGGDLVVGTATTLRTDRPPDAPPLGWWEVIGDYGLPRHDPQGRWLYGVEIAVHPDYQRRGIATALYRARLALVPELGLAGWYAGGMLMGYHRYADVLSPRAYAERVIAGELVDPTVTMQLNRGLQPRGIIEGYYPEPRAGGCAVLLVWEPPRTAPAKGRMQPLPAPRQRRPGAPPTLQASALPPEVPAAASSATPSPPASVPAASSSASSSASPSASSSVMPPGSPSASPSSRPSPKPAAQPSVPQPSAQPSAQPSGPLRPSRPSDPRS
jgi:GNAT superfamily N-acetyltransferase